MVDSRGVLPNSLIWIDFYTNKPKTAQIVPFKGFAEPRILFTESPLRNQLVPLRKDVVLDSPQHRRNRAEKWVY